MARGRNQSMKLIYIEQYLMQNTDEQHPATMDKILSYLEENDISISKKTLSADIETLMDMGVKIERIRVGPAAAFYVANRNFAASELKLLVDAVQSSKFIPEAQSLNLIKRLEALGSSHQAKLLHRQVWVRGRVKTMNESIFTNVDSINDAISANKQICFKYFNWNSRKERVPRRNGDDYIVSPWALLLDNENYYLLAYEKGLMKHFRVDKMEDIRCSVSARDGRDEFEKLDMPAYTDRHFGMFSGETVPVKLCFDNSLAGVAVDQFGTDTIFIPYDESHFTVTVNVAVTIQFFGWLSGLGSKVRILSPQSAVDGMKAHLLSIVGNYGIEVVPFGSLLNVYDSIIFFDLETTGFDTKTDQITEFACVKVSASGNQIVHDTFVKLPDGVSIPQPLVEMTGITDEMCETGITRKELYDLFSSLLDEKTLLVAHNAQFDLSFMMNLAQEFNGEYPGVDYLDTLTVFRDRKVAPHKLADAITYYGVDGKNSHRAIDDAKALMGVAKAMCIEKDDLLSYVNLFGYKMKYGIGSDQLPGVTYLPQPEDENHMALPKLRDLDAAYRSGNYDLGQPV